MSKLLVRHDSVDLLLPRVHKPDDCVDQVQGALNWSLEQLRQCQWTPSKRQMARQLAEAFTKAAIAATELASGEHVQKALFDPGPGDGSKVQLSEVLKVWNEHFECASVPTDKRRAALKAGFASRSSSPIGGRQWNERAVRHSAVARMTEAG